MIMIELIGILLFGGVLALIAEKFHPRAPVWTALAVIISAGIYLLWVFIDLPAISSQPTDPNNAQTWLMHISLAWIPSFGIRLELAMDGLSLLMVALSLVLGAVAVCSSWTDVKQKLGFFEANLLWTLAGVLGVFLAMDMILFFLFWEVMLIPMYFLIAIWGHEKRAYAAMKFFIFTQASGLLMLVAIITLASLHQQSSGEWSFSYFDLLNTPLSQQTAHYLMLGFFIAFVVKLPSFPFHPWLADAHTQAPTAGSVILAGILLKTGAYGLIRFAIPLFPQASLEFSKVAMLLGAAGIIYGAVLAFRQTDFKRLVAYSSVSHMGFVLLGIYAWNELALQGAVMQMVAHGFSTSALFMVAGSLQQRLHSRDLNLMGGLWQSMPRMGAVSLFFIIASLGLPGLGNFVAEFLVLLGLFQTDRWLAVIAALGLITGAAYCLILMQRSFQGEPSEKHRGLVDYGGREMVCMTVMMLALIILGLYPQPVLDVARPVVVGLLQFAGAGVNLAGLAP